MQELDRAYGDVQEIRKWMPPPAHFKAHVETSERVEHAEALMAGATELILQMTGWLTAQQLAVTTFKLALKHERGRASLVLQKPIRLLVRNERPFYGTLLRIIGGSERIEAGWWNDQTVARDYYVAQGEEASCFWIYLERTADAQRYPRGSSHR
ncbi:hypothetical protein ACEN9F_10935 [Duganella sp. CT11-25]|uniref:hypothetical protein n=1 Tax=unclassified Duganella TaxID=2636909 RepID=UPI0039AEDFCB